VTITSTPGQADPGDERVRPAGRGRRPASRLTVAQRRRQVLQHEADRASHEQVTGDSFAT
jgi:hypothetical protein